MGNSILTQKGGGGDNSGRLLWERYTIDGTFLDYVVSDDIYDYPINGTQNGYYYKIPTSAIENLTWQEIHDIAYAGDAQTILPIGTQKTITLTTDEVITVEVADFDHDTLQDGTTAPISFIMKDCFNTSYPMNSSNTNVGGWKGSALRTTLNSTILNTFPSELQSLIKYTKKQRYNGGGSVSTLNTIYDKLWIPSEKELFGTYTETGASGEGTQYSIFTDNESRIKYRDGSKLTYWTSSAYQVDKNFFIEVYYGGYIECDDRHSTYYSNNVIAGFCI